MMKSLDTRMVVDSGFSNAATGNPIGPRKAYRVTGVVVSISNEGSEMLVQWKCRDTWEHRSFVVSSESVFVINDCNSFHWSSTRPADLEPGDDVTIDYMLFGGKKRALVIRVDRKESALEVNGRAESVQASVESLFCPGVDVALTRIA